MKNKKVLVLGYFGYNTGQIDGQTVKTRSLYELLKDRVNPKSTSVSYFDTQSLRFDKLAIFNLLRLLLVSDSILFVGARRNLTYFFPLLFMFCFAFNRKISYVVVGGWLYDFLLKKPIYRFMLSRIAFILPETKYLCEQLSTEYKFNNVRQLTNFRLSNFSVGSSVRSKRRKIVFMARVNPNKGVPLIFKLGASLRDSIHKDVVIDIYGPIEETYKCQFLSELEKSEGNIRYKGTAEPRDVHNILAKYEFLIFPTKYYTEGFPGTILDAYISGLPVIVSEWKYAKEFVVDGKTGVIAPFDDDSGFINEVIKLLDNPEILEELRAGSRLEARKYSPENAWEILSQIL